MNIIHTSLVSKKPFFFILRRTAAVRQVSPFSTIPKYTSTNHTLKNQPPTKPKKQIPSTWSETIKKKAGKPNSWPRPNEIPYQAKVSNSVNLIGKIEMPIKFHATPDGKHMAATFISHKNGVFNGNYLNSILIPVVFDGDLAHIVACHVKEGDCVFVTGKLSLEPLPFVLGENQGKFYVVGSELNFVEGLEMKGGFDHVEKDVGKGSLVEEVVVGEDIKVKNEWEELLDKPNRWWVVTSQDDGLKGAIEGFERKVDGKRLDLDSSTPVWVYKKLEMLNFENKIEEKGIEQVKTEERRSSDVGGTRKDGDSVLNPWRDLVKNPRDWRDYRESKSSGSLKANYPDFKHKTNGTALWLNKAPNWVLQGLEGLDFDTQVQVPKGPRAKGGKGKNEDSWKSLVENPDKWWDNRLGKTNVKAPDFKHKENGEALWLDSSPEWALSQLPPLKNEQDVAAGNKKAYVA